MKYRSEIDIEGLIKTANKELRDAAPEAYEIFLLAVAVGLSSLNRLFFIRLLRYSAAKLHLWHAQISGCQATRKVALRPRLDSKEFERFVVT